LQEVTGMFHQAHDLGMYTVLWCYMRNAAFKTKEADYHVAADLTGQANHLGVTIEADIIKQKLPENNGGYNAVNFGKTHKKVYSELSSDHPIDLTRYQLANCYMGRAGLINSGGASAGESDLKEAVKTAVMAASDYFEIIVRGKGAHGGLPHEGIDPVLIGSHIVVALQSLVSRNVDPVDSAVVSCCVFEGAKANNVIPDFARLGGNARTFRPQTRELVEKGIHRIARDIASAMGGSAEVSFQRGYPETVNTAAESALAARVAADIVGSEGVILDAPPTTTSEDFGFMLQERPGCYVLIGSEDPQHTSVLHHPLYDFNDAILAVGTRYWIRLVQTLLPPAA